MPTAPLQPAALQPDAVAETLSPDFPGERLMVCFNPRLREERARKREDLLRATEAILERIAQIVRRAGSQLRGRDRINRRVGREAKRVSWRYITRVFAGIGASRGRIGKRCR